MFKKFRKKPIEIWAIQFTQKIQKSLEKRGCMGRDCNPIDIQLDIIPKFNFQWNKHTKQLLIDTKEGQMVCNPNDWIVKEPFDKKRQYYPVKEEVFNQTYESVEVS